MSCAASSSGRRRPDRRQVKQLPAQGTELLTSDSGAGAGVLGGAGGRGGAIGGAGCSQ